LWDIYIDMKLIDTIQDIITEHKWGSSKLPERIIDRRLKKAKELAVNFPNPRQFALKYKKLWYFLRSQNLVDEVFPNRQKYGEDFTREKVKELADKFIAPSDFQKEHPTAYQYALKRNMLNDLFPNKLDRISTGVYTSKKDESPYYNDEVQKHLDHLIQRASSQYKDMNDLRKRNPNLFSQLQDLGHDYVPEDMMEQQTSNLTVPEQTLLGFLNRFLRGEDGEFQNTPIEQLKKTMMFNSKTIYPMAQKLIEKKNTGKKTYDDKIFNSLFMSMDKSITKEQRYEFFNDGGTITKITYNSQF
jgi:hypothetical protein